MRDLLAYVHGQRPRARPDVGGRLLDEGPWRRAPVEGVGGRVVGGLKVAVRGRGHGLGQDEYGALREE